MGNNATQPHVGNVLLEAALSYAAQGYKVLPLRPGEKVPQTAHGFKDASSDAQVVTSWWDAYPSANVGIATGIASGIVVLDVDVKNGCPGAETMAKLANQHGPLVTRSVKTPSGGMHLYFRAPTECASCLNRAATLGLDLKGNGGYVVAPPSVVDGESYSWIPGPEVLAPLPSWLPSVFAEAATKVGPDAASAMKDPLAGVPQGSRNNEVFRYACALRARGLTRNEAGILVIEKAGRCNPPLSTAEARKCLASAWRYREVRDLNDLGNADRFVELHGRELIHVTETEQWYRKAGDVYTPATPAEIASASRDVINLLSAAARNATDKGRGRELSGFARQLGNRGRLEAMTKLAGTLQPVAKRLADLDADIWIAGTRQGPIDLRTGQLTKLAGIVTKLLGPDYDPTAKCPQFDKFVSQIFEGNPEVMGFVQRIAGYLLSGSTEEHVAFWFFGPGANGKSVLLNILQAVLGEYAVTLPAYALQHTHSTNRFSLGTLPGARMIRVSEVGPGYKIDDALLKDLTGGDPVTAELKFRAAFEFAMMGKLTCATNHLPGVAGTDHGFWRRQVVIPMNHIFSTDEQDKTLETRIRRTELSGVLNWMLEGLSHWRMSGLCPPKAVQVLVADFRRDEDPFEPWAAECCMFVPGHETAASALYASYKAFSGASGELALSQKRLGRWLRERKQLTTNPAKKSVYYVGIQLNANAGVSA